MVQTILQNNRTSSLLNAFALGQQEWFIQLCKGKNAVPKAKLRNKELNYKSLQMDRRKLHKMQAMTSFKLT